MWSSTLVSCLWDSGFELTAKHLIHTGGGEAGRCEPSCLPNGARKGAVATSPGEADANGQAFPPARGSHIRTATEPPPLLPGNSFQVEGSRLCYDFSKSMASHFTLSKQGEGFSPILMNNATLIKHSWVH